MKRTILINQIHSQFAQVFGSNQIEPLDNILSRESGFDPWVVNQSSHACGLFQFLPCEKIGGRVYFDEGMGKWRLDPESAPVDKQIKAGIKYIADRYQDPVSAWEYWQAHRWY